MPRPTPQPDSSPGLARVLERNIAALLARRQAEVRARTADQRLAQAISDFSGSMAFVYLHLAIVGGWIAINLGLTPLRPFDPSFVILACAASVEAIFLSTFVLITQNRMAAEAAQRANLDLQISLLAEHEITRIVAIVSAVAEQMGVEAARDPELAELTQDVQPERVLDRLESSDAGA
jgi:uncharacterized membrane protein